MRRLAIATGNPGKLRELRELLRDPGLEVVACPVEVVEDLPSYAGNAERKAEAARNATGLAALGDDSGLEVSALGGFPGLHSRRIAATQPERNAIVLARLREVPRPWRARFRCALALALADGSTQVFCGEVEGEVVEPRNGGHGFGYDPLFLLPERGLTFGELPDAEKRWLSHRARAVTALRARGALQRLPDA